MKVFGNRRLKPHQWTEVQLGVVRYEEWNEVACNCGWRYRHDRNKIRENAVDRHFTKRHGGSGIRL